MENVTIQTSTYKCIFIELLVNKLFLQDEPKKTPSSTLKKYLKIEGLFWNLKIALFINLILIIFC